MTEPYVPDRGILPEGETDPNLIYIAVGQAIHDWEVLEMALARLYLIMSGIDETPANFATYGFENGRFVNRIAAIERAAAVYFVRHPNQEVEGAFCELIQTTKALSIDRHRIAHGNISQVGKANPMPGPTKDGTFMMQVSFLFRWGAPLYSTRSLRTNFVGGGSKAINAVRDKIKAKHNEIHAFTQALPR